MHLPDPPPPSDGGVEPRFSQLGPRLRAREGMRSRQLLIDLDNATDPTALAGESISNIRDQANKALLLSHGTPTLKVRAVTKLCNGGVQIEFNSDEAVEWLQDAERRRAFLTQLHKSAIIKPRMYNVITQFVPPSFRPKKDTELHEVEESNGLGDGNIVRARWIKPVMWCSPSQVCGHAILSFLSPQPANDVLAGGLFICQKKVYVEKCKREPLHCLKCQGWNHMASSCLQLHDTCGTCAQCHHMAACTSPNKYQCVSCSSDNHASWDRSCPSFLCKCAELNNHVEENRMPYFPTLETWTQAWEPEKPICPLGPLPHLQQPAPRGLPRFAQTTLSRPQAGPPRHKASPGPSQQACQGPSQQACQGPSQQACQGPSQQACQGPTDPQPTHKALPPPPPPICSTCLVQLSYNLIS